MNHSYKLSLTNPTRCAEASCNRPLTDHTDSAQCEACPNIGPCELLNGMLLCATCYAHDIELQGIQEREKQLASDPKQQRITELVNSLTKEIPTDSRQYFVNEVTQIVDIEQKVRDTGIDNPQFKFCEIIEQRIISFRRNLFEVKKLELELKMDMIADQKYLNTMVPKLREEEREKFKQYDITYKPQTVAITSKVSGPRMSASERALESFAKMMGISIEQAKISMANAVKSSTGAACTCSETPGLCKVHPKG